MKALPLAASNVLCFCGIGAACSAVPGERHGGCCHWSAAAQAAEQLVQRDALLVHPGLLPFGIAALAAVHQTHTVASIPTVIAHLRSVHSSETAALMDSFCWQSVIVPDSPLGHERVYSDKSPNAFGCILTHIWCSFTANRSLAWLMHHCPYFCSELKCCKHMGALGTCLVHRSSRQYNLHGALYAAFVFSDSALRWSFHSRRHFL